MTAVPPTLIQWVKHHPSPNPSEAFCRFRVILKSIWEGRGTKTGKTNLKTKNQITGSPLSDLRLMLLSRLLHMKLQVSQNDTEPHTHTYTGTPHQGQFPGFDIVTVLQYADTGEMTKAHNLPLLVLELIVSL
jgi:hypothetical protein